MATQKRDYYEVLEIDRNASAEEIKKAYRRQAVKYHPDKNPGDKDAEELFKEISEAYEILADPAKKQRYDQYGHQAFGPGTGGGAGGFGLFPYTTLFRSVHGRLRWRRQYLRRLLRHGGRTGRRRTRRGQPRLGPAL